MIEDCLTKKATVQAQDVKMIEDWSLWDQITKENRGKQINQVCL